MLVNQIHERKLTNAIRNGHPQAEGSGGKNILNVAEMINITMERYLHKSSAAFTFYLIKSLQVFDVIKCHNTFRFCCINMLLYPLEAGSNVTGHTETSARLILQYCIWDKEGQFPIEIISFQVSSGQVNCIGLKYLTVLADF